METGGMGIPWNSCAWKMNGVVIRSGASIFAESALKISTSWADLNWHFPLHGLPCPATSLEWSILVTKHII